jgi:4-hydroxy-tetrahydrodipicolinate synthase
VKYRKSEAKEYAKENMRGIWAAALNPFGIDGTFDEEGLRRNIRHWIDDLEIAGLFIAGKQGEFFSMTLEERKRNFEIAVEECDGRAGTIMSASDQNFATVVELARHAQAIGADYVVVHAPMRRSNGSTISRSWAGTSTSAPRRPTSCRRRPTGG